MSPVPCGVPSGTHGEMRPVEVSVGHEGRAGVGGEEGVDGEGHDGVLSV